MTDTLNLGGTEVQLTQIAARMNSERYRVTVGCLRAEGPLLPMLKSAGIPVKEFRPAEGLLTRSGVAQILRLARFLRRERFDVVQTNDLYSNLLGVPAAWLARVPVIISSRRDLSRWWWYTPRNRRILRFIQSLSTFVVVNSEAVREFLIGEDGFDGRTIRVIRNGVDLERFSPATMPKARATVAEQGDQQVVITVANMNIEGKGHVDLIDAARLICNTLPKTKFLLVGDGPERQKLERKVAELQLENNVVFLGHREDVPHLLSYSNISVLPSWWEGLPNVVLESMAAGVPIVATNVGGTPEIIEHMWNGVLVPPRNPSGLANAVLELLQDSTLAEKLGGEARAHVERNFNYGRVLRELQTLYDEGLHGSDMKCNERREKNIHTFSEGAVGAEELRR
jgi:L-malate glycosyltransferase